MNKQHIVFLTGAGISAESGLSTFRGKNGLWTNEEWVYLASTDALYHDTQRCLDFYNFRREQLAEVDYLISCHRAYIININYAVSLTSRTSGNYQLQMLGIDKLIPVSRANTVEIKKALQK